MREGRGVRGNEWSNMQNLSASLILALQDQEAEYSRARLA